MKDLHNSIRRILWEEWDPIGVRGDDWPNDEYDSYAPKLVEFVVTGRDEYAIASYLAQVETNAMGLSNSNDENNKRVARLILSLRST